MREQSLHCLPSYKSIKVPDTQGCLEDSSPAQQTLMEWSLSIGTKSGLQVLRDSKHTKYISFRARWGGLGKSMNYCNLRLEVDFKQGDVEGRRI